MSTIRDMLAANGTTVNHGVLIDGIDVVFVVKWPVSPTGIPWALPDDSQGHAYRDVLEVVDDTGGIAISEEAWDPQGGMMAGGYAQIRLDLTDDVLDVFATRHPAVRKTLLTADLRHDGVGAPADYEQLEVRSTSGFPASGFVHVQNECIYYPAVTGATFGISPTDPCTRRSYVWSTDDRGDFRHESSVDRAEPLLWVADRPLSFKGRRIRVLQWLCDPHGRAYDVTWRGAFELTVWKGLIDVVHYGTAGDYGTLVIDCVPLTSRIVNRRIGLEPARGYLMHPEGFGTGGGERVTWQNRYVRQVRFWGVSGGASFAPAARTDIFVRHHATGIPLRPGSPLTAQDAAQSLAKSLSDLINGELLLAGFGGVTVTIAARLLAEDEAANGEVNQQAELTLTVAGATEFSWDFDLTPFDAMTGIRSWVGGPIDPTHVGRVVSPRRLLTATVLDSDRALRYQPDPADLTEWPSGPGAACIEFGDIQEFIGYRSRVDLGDGTFLLVACRRGQYGSQRRNYHWPAGGDFTQTAPKIRWLHVWYDVHVAELLLQALLSTGEGSAHPTYDVLPRSLGLHLDPGDVDVESFEALFDEPYARRTLVVDRPTSLEDLIEQAGILHGFVFGPRMGRDGRYRLALLPTPMPTLAGGLLSLDTADNVLADPKPELRSSMDVISGIEFESGYDPWKGEFGGLPAHLTFHNGIVKFGDDAMLKVGVEGLAGADVAGAALYLAERLFAIFGDEQTIIELDVNRSGLLAFPGGGAAVTAPGVPTPFGSFGLSAATAVMLSVTKDPYSPGTARGARVKALLTAAFGGIAPNLRISSYVGGAATFVAADNVYTRPGDESPAGEAECRDWHWFEAGVDYLVVVYNRGAFDAREQRSVNRNTGTATFNLSAPLTIPTGGAYQTVVRFVPWGTPGRDAEQGKFVHIADTSEQLAGGERGFEWSP